MMMIIINIIIIETDLLSYNIIIKFIMNSCFTKELLVTSVKGSSKVIISRLHFMAGTEKASSTCDWLEEHVETGAQLGSNRFPHHLSAGVLVCSSEIVDLK